MGLHRDVKGDTRGEGPSVERKLHREGRGVSSVHREGTHGEGTMYSENMLRK